MAKGLLRNLTNIMSSRFGRPFSKKIRADARPNELLRNENTDRSPQNSNFVVGTTTIKDLKTGEYLQAEVIDRTLDHGVEKSAVISDSQPSQMDKIKLRARNEAYIEAVKGLIALNLDSDIFSDAMNELREKYYGKDVLPAEVVIVVENLRQKVQKTQ